MFLDLHKEGPGRRRLNVSDSYHSARSNPLKTLDIMRLCAGHAAASSDDLAFYKGSLLKLKKRPMKHRVLIIISYDNNISIR